MSISVLSLQNFHGWSILFSKMLQIAFAIVTGAKKVHRWLHLLNRFSNWQRATGKQRQYFGINRRYQVTR